MSERDLLANEKLIPENQAALLQGQQGTIVASQKTLLAR